MVRSTSLATLSSEVAAASPTWAAVSAAVAYLLARRRRLPGRDPSTDK